MQPKARGVKTMRNSSPPWTVRSQMLGRWLVSGSLPIAIMRLLVFICIYVVRMVAVDIDHVEYAPHYGGLHIGEPGYRLAQELTGGSIALNHQYHPVHARCQDGGVSHCHQRGGIEQHEVVALLRAGDERGQPLGLEQLCGIGGGSGARDKAQALERGRVRRLVEGGVPPEELCYTRPLIAYTRELLQACLQRVGRARRLVEGGVPPEELH